MSDLDWAYQVLGLPSGANLEDVASARLDLLKVWHPDRFANDPRLQRKAEEQAKRINAAFCAITDRLTSHRDENEYRAADKEPPPPHRPAQEAQAKVPASPSNPAPLIGGLLILLGVVFFLIIVSPGGRHEQPRSSRPPAQPAQPLASREEVTPMPTRQVPSLPLRPADTGRALSTNQIASPTPGNAHESETVELAENLSYGAVYEGNPGLVFTSQLMKTATWPEAQRLCAGYSSGGFSDWRLPLNSDLESIGYQDVVLGSVWTIESDLRGLPPSAVMCVRERDRKVLESEVVFDGGHFYYSSFDLLASGVLKSKVPPAEALETCTKHRVGGIEGWRLPTRSEALSIGVLGDFWTQEAGNSGVLFDVICVRNRPNNKQVTWNGIGFVHSVWPTLVVSKVLEHDVTASKARRLCKSHGAGGYDDWRLPTLTERSVLGFGAEIWAETGGASKGRANVVCVRTSTSAG